MQNRGLFSNENKFLSLVADALNAKFESTQQCDSYDYFESIRANTCSAKNKSNKNLEIYVYDSTMYTNYANHLLNAQQTSNSSSYRVHQQQQKPRVILIDYKVFYC